MMPLTESCVAALLLLSVFGVGVARFGRLRDLLPAATAAVCVVPRIRARSYWAERRQNVNHAIECRFNPACRMTF